MYTERIGPLKRQGTDPQSQVIVKMKQTREVRSVLRTAASEGRMPKRTGPLQRVIQSAKVLSVEPVFGEVQERAVRGLRRIALAATAEPDPALAGLTVLTTPSHKDAAEACKEIRRDPLVELAYVPPEKYLMRATRRPRRTGADTLANRQWLRAIELFQAESGAGFPDPAGVVVAVVDSGVDSAHPDLQGIFTDELNFTTGSLKDTSGHGTHVSGIIAALRNNQRGIRGVVRSRNIMSLKALGPYSAAGYYRAIRHAIDNGAKVMNFSLGGGYDPTEETLIKRAVRAGIVVVAAMGNEKKEGNPTSYPAAIPGVIAVGASTETDGIADFSCTGRHIDLVAPGVNILSTIPRYPTRLADGTDYEAWPGTSMATPLVAATAALLLAKRPNATPAQIRRALTRSADKVPGQRGFNTTFGNGRLNVRKALRQA